MTTFVHSFCSRHFLCVDHESYPTVGDLKHAIFNIQGLPCDSCFFIWNGKLVEDNEPVRPNSVYHTYHRLPGGKGGFGSMLRAIGAQIEKTTNHEACRDLSGRRMRDINNEKDLKDWLGKQAEREREKEQRRQERIARRRAIPNHKFEDPTYDQQRMLLSENQEDALLKGLQKTKVKAGTSATVTSEELAGCKRKCETVTSDSAAKKKKDTEWLGIDMEDMSDLDSDEDSEDITGGACAKPGPSTDSDNSRSSGEQDRIDACPGTSRSDTSSGTSQVENSPDNTESTHSTNENSSTATSHTDGYESTTDSSVADSSQTEKQGENTQNTKSTEEISKHEDGSKTSSSDTTDTQEDKPLNLEQVTTVKELEALGLEKLKAELMSRGLKCGGTLEQRADRLFSVKGLTPDQIDPALFAKSNGKKVKNKK